MEVARILTNFVYLCLIINLFVMKKLLLFLFLLCPFALMAQTSEPATGTIVDVTTFTGIMAIVTAIATQVAKVIPAIDSNKWLKVLTSLLVGVLVCVICWLLNASPLLQGLLWWQALLYGVAVGVSAGGFYDLVKVVWNLFGKKE